MVARLAVSQSMRAFRLFLPEERAGSTLYAYESGLVQPGAAEQPA